MLLNEEDIEEQMPDGIYVQQRYSKQVLILYCISDELFNLRLYTLSDSPKLG